jgi:hypothetical protein
MAGVIVTSCRGKVGFLTVHKKAVPAMMGVYETKTHHGGTANGPGKEVGPPAAAG